MKKVALVLFLLISFSTFAQKYYTKTGNTQFKASVEAFEPVEATNNSTTAIINVTTGEIASLLFVKAFNFRVALMQEHFNENYMDSSTFPKATFKGLISDFNFPDISSTEKKYLLKGILTIRGIEKEIRGIWQRSEKAHRRGALRGYFERLDRCNYCGCFKIRS